MVQKLWERLIFQTVTGEFEECDKLCGVRLLDKSQPSKESCFRIEIWTKFSSDSEEEGKNMRRYIDEKLVSMIKECPDQIASVSASKFTQHKSPPATGNKMGLQKHHSNKWELDFLLNE